MSLDHFLHFRIYFLFCKNIFPEHSYPFSPGSAAFISDNRILTVEHCDRKLLLNRNPHPFDFDMVPIDSTITVWNGETCEEIATSPHMPELRRGNIRLSPRGTHMIIEDHKATIYRLPE